MKPHAQHTLFVALHILGRGPADTAVGATYGALNAFWLSSGHLRRICNPREGPPARPTVLRHDDPPIFISIVLLIPATALRAASPRSACLSADGRTAACWPSWFTLVLRPDHFCLGASRVFPRRVAAPRPPIRGRHVTSCGGPTTWRCLELALRAAPSAFWRHMHRARCTP